ncbi:MAG: hypothetical protein O2999_04670 [Nitrospirae bacterium]|nr:hypothetical protein [Nitrospirota bacterium]MDA1303579.1 hypothetical protein [Nitrospirota bacterium]
MKFLLGVLIVAFLYGCAINKNISPIGVPKIEKICVEKNTKVLMDGFHPELILQLEEIGIETETYLLERPDPSSLRGRADLFVSQIIDLNLTVVPNAPPPRHADIKDFPSNGAELNSRSFQIQQKLADRAEGFLSKDVEPGIDNILNEDVAVRPEFESFLEGPTSA